MPSAFISYRRASSSILAQYIAKELRVQRIDTFLDVKQTDGGGSFPDRLLRAIEKHDFFICLVADGTFDSEWVRTEIQHAHELGKVLIPVFQESYQPLPDPPDEHVNALLQSDGVKVLDRQNLYVDEAIAKLAELIRATRIPRQGSGIFPREKTVDFPVRSNWPVIGVVVVLLVVIAGILSLSGVWGGRDNGNPLSSNTDVAKTVIADVATKTAIAMMPTLTNTPESAILTNTSELTLISTSTPKPTTTRTNIPEPTFTNTLEPTLTPTKTSEPTTALTLTNTSTYTPTLRPTATLTNSPEPTFTLTRTPEPTTTSTWTNTPTLTPALRSTATPTATLDPTSTPTNTPNPTQTFTRTPTLQSTPWSGQGVTLPIGGVTINLVWNAAVDLNLEVRDPVGGTVHRNSPASPSGGTLDSDTNANCATANADGPSETISWPPGTIPAGSYEIIVYYSDGCSVSDPQLFTLNTSVNNGTAQSLIGTLNPGQNYLARLIVASDGSWRLENGGINAGLDIGLFRNEITNANSIVLNSRVSGLITNSIPAQAYTFTAQGGTSINITVQAQSGGLDTYLVLLGPNNTPIASNDDLGDSTNSAISVGLFDDGTYTILVTRYGLTIGGTEGEFSLTLTASDSTGSGSVTTPTTDTLPNGAIEVKLEWATEADLQLLVRDPLGNAVYDNIPISESGGVLESVGNQGCLEPTSVPISYIYWPWESLLPGTYEVEVWFQNTCDDPRLVNFELSVEVQNQLVIDIWQPASPGSRYMTNFTVSQTGVASHSDGGFFDMDDPTPLNFLSQLTSAATISYGQTVSNSITLQEGFRIYAFSGRSGDVVSIGMNSRSGTLDPALYLISPDNLPIAANDDVIFGENPNSLIDEVTLPSTGTYYIISTRYGLNYGGTTGTFELSLVQNR